MARVVLGLDIGGANLKAATPDRRAVSVPFALYKHPDQLSARLAAILAHFPDATEFAVTMTGELCDCFATKREGVKHILKAVRSVARSYDVRVWGTDGRFRTCPEAEAEYMTVAAANWHALATYCGSWVAEGVGILLDIGSTTTDVVGIADGLPSFEAATDPKRLLSEELVYTGVRRTPLCALLPRGGYAAELFATTLDAYLLLGHIAEDPADSDTADGRPATKDFAHARISRMLGGDPVITSAAETLNVAGVAADQQRRHLEAVVVRRFAPTHRERKAGRAMRNRVAIVSGSGEFLALSFLNRLDLLLTDTISLADRLGPDVAACAPAFAVAVLAQERPA